jgi:hypothetical protein
VNSVEHQLRRWPNSVMHAASSSESQSSLEECVGEAGETAMKYLHPIGKESTCQQVLSKISPVSQSTSNTPQPIASRTRGKAGHYCTLECLLGLKRGCLLDRTCHSIGIGGITIGIRSLYVDFRLKFGSSSQRPWMKTVSHRGNKAQEALCLKSDIGFMDTLLPARGLCQHSFQTSSPMKEVRNRLQTID